MACCLENPAPSDGKGVESLVAFVGLVASVAEREDGNSAGANTGSAGVGSADGNSAGANTGSAGVGSVNVGSTTVIIGGLSANGVGEDDRTSCSRFGLIEAGNGGIVGRGGCGWGVFQTILSVRGNWNDSVRVTPDDLAGTGIGAAGSDATGVGAAGAGIRFGRTGLACSSPNHTKYPPLDVRVVVAFWP